MSLKSNDPAVKRTKMTASRCIHLRIEPFIPVEQVPVPSNIQIPGTPQGQMVERRLAGLPTLMMVCHSVDNIGNLRGQLPPDLAHQVTRLAITLDLCTVCPFWRAMHPQDDAKPKGNVASVQ